MSTDLTKKDTSGAPVAKPATAPAGAPTAPSSVTPPPTPQVPLQKPSTQSAQIGKYLVEVIREKCISAGSCVAIAPKVFELDEEGLARIISQDGNDDETKLLAAQSCPTAAIIVTDTETGKQVWPPLFDEE
jgi:ferredoxin